ncbi:hypothetical protein, partial [Burkholderia ambifaria]
DKNHAGDPNPWKKLSVNSNPFLPAIRPEGSPLGGNSWSLGANSDEKAIQENLSHGRQKIDSGRAARRRDRRDRTLRICG